PPGARLLKVGVVYEHPADGKLLVVVEVGVPKDKVLHDELLESARYVWEDRVGDVFGLAAALRQCDLVLGGSVLVRVRPPLPRFLGRRGETVLLPVFVDYTAQRQDRP